MWLRAEICSRLAFQPPVAAASWGRYGKLKHASSLICETLSHQLRAMTLRLLLSTCASLMTMPLLNHKLLRTNRLQFMMARRWCCRPDTPINWNAGSCEVIAMGSISPRPTNNRRTNGDQSWLLLTRCRPGPARQVTSARCWIVRGTSIVDSQQRPEWDENQAKH